MEGVQVDGESAGLAVPFAALSAHVRPIPSVRSHVAGQLNGLGEHRLAILTHVHLS